MGATIPLEDFCAQYGLSDRIRAALEDIQFAPGDDLSSVTDVEWTEVGLARLAVNRVKNANKIFRRLQREGAQEY
jgi:hypothetical protein